MYIKSSKDEEITTMQVCTFVGSEERRSLYLRNIVKHEEGKIEVVPPK
jgi:hypothetical protein